MKRSLPLMEIHGQPQTILSCASEVGLWWHEYILALSFFSVFGEISSKIMMIDIQFREAGTLVA